MTRALILAPFDPIQLERLRQSIGVACESWFDTRRLNAPDELAQKLNGGGFSILVVESDFVFEETFEQAQSLKFVGICRAATHQIDLDAATRHGVIVVSAPGRNAQAVAEHVLALMLSLARRIPEAHQHVKKGLWQNPVEPYITMRGIELAGRALGIIGLGAIGRRVAAIGAALGMRVLAFDPYVKDCPPGVALVSLDALCAASDFITLHVPLTPETEKLLDAAKIALMKPSAYLVSASDTSTIDQPALVDALRQKRIAGAAFDVFETHPVAPDSPLLRLDNVIFTPHLGGATQETIQRHSRMITDDILLFLNGQRPKHLVNPEVWKDGG